MKTNWKITSLILALVLALTLGAGALAESAAETPADSAAADAAKSALEEAQASADAAQTEATALNEALEAYGKAKTEKRKLDILTSLKEDLDSYVAAGSLTQEQADLIFKYYSEQMALQQNGFGFGKGGRMKNGNNGLMNGQDSQNNLNGQNGLNGQGGKGGRGGHGRFNNPNGMQQNAAPAAAPDAAATPDVSGT